MELTSALQPGDRLVVSELSRLGRSLGQVVAVLDALAKAGVAFVALKENIRVEGKRDIQTKVMTTLFALFAEVERDLISERTREGLAKSRASGRKLGRPKGSLGVSRRDGEEDEIRHFLELGVSKTAIAKITAYLSNGGTLEHAQQIAEPASPKTTKLYDMAMMPIIGAEHEFHDPAYSDDWAARFEPTPARLALFDLLRICAWPRPCRRFSRACARRPRRSTSWSGSESCASSSRRSSSMTTRS